jgi:hypothetical protein
MCPLLFSLIVKLFGHLKKEGKLQLVLPRFVLDLLVDWHGDLETRKYCDRESNASVFNLDHLD